MTEDWREDALCRQVDPELWFPEKGGDNGAGAKRMCASCPVVDECREYAVETWQPYGVWGGKSPQQLAEIRRERGMVHPLTPVNRRPERAA